MATKRVDLVIQRGVDWEHTFEVVDDSAAAVNIADDEFEMQLRERPLGTVYAEPTLTIVSAAGGTVKASLTDDITREIYIDEAVYDLVRVNSADGKRSRVAEGRVFISADVTR